MEREFITDVPYKEINLNSPLGFYRNFERAWINYAVSIKRIHILKTDFDIDKISLISGKFLIFLFTMQQLRSRFSDTFS